MNIRSVAKRAKVSTATVSRTVNNLSSVNPKTAQRVMRAIEELGYHPNGHARSLVLGRSRILGLIVSDIVNPFFPEVLKSFEDLAVQQEYEVLLGSTNYDPERMARCVGRMLERKVEGVAIMTSEMLKPLVDQFAHSNVPLVFLDVGSVKEGVSNISVDYAQGINEAVQHLLALHHQHIGFISGPLTLKSAQIRRSAFLHSLGSFGLDEKEQLIALADHTIDGGVQAMTRLLQLKPLPTAVLCSNDLTAFGALRAIRRAGLRVPDDISVVGFDDIHLAGFTEPPLTTIRLSRSELARQAFDALLRHIDRGRAGEEHAIETHLIVRESTAQATALHRRLSPGCSAPATRALVSPLFPAGEPESPPCDRSTLRDSA